MSDLDDNEEQLYRGQSSETDGNHQRRLHLKQSFENAYCVFIKWLWYIAQELVTNAGRLRDHMHHSKYMKEDQGQWCVGRQLFFERSRIQGRHNKSLVFITRRKF